MTFLEGLKASLGAGDPALAGRVVLIAEIDRYNFDTSADDPLFVATDEYATLPTDTPANQSYLAVLRAPNYNQSVLGSGDFLHSTGTTFDRVRLLNINKRLDREFDRDKYDIKGREIELMKGLQGDAFSTFENMPGGRKRIIEVILSDQFVELVLTDLVDRPDQLLLPNKYGGFDSAYDFAGTADVNVGDDFNLGLRDCTVEIRFKTAIPTVSDAVLFGKRSGFTGSATSAGWTALMNTSGELRIWLDDGTNFHDELIGSAGEFDDDVWHRLTVRLIRSDGDLTVSVDGTVEVSAVDISAVSGTLSNSDNYVIGATDVPGNQWQGELDEALIWYVDLTTELQAALDTSFAISGYEEGLVSAHQFDDRADPTRNDIIGPASIYAILDGTMHADAGNVCDPGTGDFTLVAWFRAADTDGGVIASRRPGSAGTDVGYALRLDSGVIEAIACDGSTTFTATLANPGIGAFDDDTWWGVAMVVDKTADTLTAYTIRYRSDSILNSSSAVDITGATTFGGGTVDLRISGYADSTERFTGGIVHVGFTGLALSANELVQGLGSHIVASLSSAWVDGSNIGGAAWVGVRVLNPDASSRWWAVDDGTGTTVTEYMNGDDAIFNSTPAWGDTKGDVTSGASGAWTTTLEGTPDLKGTPKPLVLGSDRSFSPILIANWGPP